MIAVLTHPRRGVSYLAGTLASTDESAQGTRIVVTDTTRSAVLLPPGWNLDAFDRPETPTPDNRWTLWRAFGLAYEAGEDLIAVEDDVKWCRNGARTAELLAVPHDVAWVALFDTGSTWEMPHGLWTSRHAAGFMYAQAIKFPWRTCALLRRLGCADYERVGSDSQLAAIGGMLGLSYAIMVPSLVQHVGSVSSVGNGGLEGRASRSWRADHDPSTERLR
jgi:hypothetical protein